jgi:hypothetical protein
MIKLKLRRKKMAEGWRGANSAGMLRNLKGAKAKCEKCGLEVEEPKDIGECIRNSKIRFAHWIGEVGKCTEKEDHVVVCEECFNVLPDGWYGCGCGG